MNNPYVSRGPIHDARMFYGRAYELNEIGGFLSGSQSVSIVGPHKIGKTSLLLHLMRPTTRAALGLGDDNLFIYIDCQALSSIHQNEILTCFCAKLTDALRSQGLEPEPALEVVVSKPTWSAFEVVVRKLNQRGLRVILMLDDLEQLTQNPNVDVNFYNALRSAASRLRMVYLTTSTRPLIDLTYIDNSTRILSSPFFNIFAQTFLGLLSKTESDILIRTPIKSAGIDVSEQLVDFIYQMVGGHPLALQIACFHAWENPDDLPKIETHTKQELEEHYLHLWGNLSGTERDVLQHPDETGSRAAGDPSLKLVLRDLTRECLLVQADGTYRYPSRAWAEFVLARQVAA